MKCLFFIIDVHFEDLINFNHNDTLRFFGDIKNCDEKCFKLQNSDFKHFIKIFKFDYCFFEQLESEYENFQEYFYKL